MKPKSSSKVAHSEDQQCVGEDTSEHLRGVKKLVSSTCLKSRRQTHRRADDVELALDKSENRDDELDSVTESGVEKAA